MENNIQIVCKDVSLGFGSEVIVSGLNFQVEKGDYLCIVGENGSGKSTLMRTLLNLIPPVGGTITFADDLARSEIGYLPQQTMAQKDFPASVYEIVLSGFEGRRGFSFLYTKEERKTARANMKQMGILDLRKKCFRDLSGGQQQRVLLARALCATRKVLLLDEPVAGLDPAVTEAMYETIDALNKEGITIIMITHDLHEALPYAKHILHIGEKLYFGSAEAYLTKGRLN
ncbi:MAG: ABC transporter ATP-binding protein [Solobacterium sp.]|nr:ABC transporter ATP-binding protein [Solobacterium sp.]